MMGTIPSTRRWLGSVVCAVALTAPSVVGPSGVAHAADTVLYVPGTQNTPSSQEVVYMGGIGSVLAMFGQYAMQIAYPASIGPFQGVLPFNMSVQQGVSSLLEAIASAPVGDRIVLIGVSQGGAVLSLAEKALLAAGTLRDVVFFRVADPSLSSGVMGRNPGIRFPGLSFIAQPTESPFDEVVVIAEYDGLGHWPVQQLNALAVVNALLGTLVYHSPHVYETDLSTLPASNVSSTVNSLGATKTTYLIPAQGILPILRPLQYALGLDDGRMMPLHNILKPIIDSAYGTSPIPSLEQVYRLSVQTVINVLSEVSEKVYPVLKRLDAAVNPPKKSAVQEVTNTGEGDVSNERVAQVATLTEHDAVPETVHSVESDIDATKATERAEVEDATDTTEKQSSAEDAETPSSVEQPTEPPPTDPAVVGSDERDAAKAERTEVREATKAERSESEAERQEAREAKKAEQAAAKADRQAEKVERQEAREAERDSAKAEREERKSERDEAKKAERSESEAERKDTSTS